MCSLVNNGNYISTKKVVIIILVVCSIIISFSIPSIILIINKSSNVPSKRFELAYVDNIIIDEIAFTSEEVTVTIKGYLSTPCWELDSHVIQTNTLIKLVNITLWAFIELPSRPCIEMIMLFTYNLTLVFPLSGNWTIECNHQSRNITVYD